MPIKFFIRGLWVFVLCLTAWTGQATSFTSKDQAFTLDMPSGWKEITPLPQGYALSIKKDAARIDIKTISCSTETCIENKINDDLADIKRKKMQVIGNSYTGEDIKRIEFSTGEPFFYISFFTPKEDFACGYFLINHHAYSILARNLTYAETDLIFSFISPQMQSKKETPEDTPSLEMDLTDPRAYDTASVPTIAEETVAAPDESSAQIEPVSKSKAASFAFPWAHVRKKLAQLHTDTFLFFLSGLVGFPSL